MVEKVIILCGPSGIGKTYYIEKKYNLKKFDIINMRDIKKKNYETINKYKNIIFHIDLTQLYLGKTKKYTKLFKFFVDLNIDDIKIFFLFNSKKNLIKRVKKRETNNYWNPTMKIRCHELVCLYKSIRIYNIYEKFITIFQEQYNRSYKFFLIKTKNPFNILDFNKEYLKSVI